MNHTIYENALNDVQEEFRDRMLKVPQEKQPHRKAINKVFALEKPIHILIDDFELTRRLELVDKGEFLEHRFHRYHTFPTGKSYRGDFGWVVDDDSILFIERPFTNKVIRLLNRLLPDHNINSFKNDIIIDNFKIGPTFETGTCLHDGTPSPNNSGCLYLLRWTNPEGLEKYFAGDPNYEARKTAGKQPIGSLDMFIQDKTKTEFITMLERMS